MKLPNNESQGTIPCIVWRKKHNIGSLNIMKSSIWFLLAAVVSLHGVAFAEDDSNESSNTEIVEQEQEKQEQTPLENAR
ncbi:MAG: hypothetical protein C5B45_02895 [Chlamydiae bacterium]|nr:MAG: hypothetical protein C5B45_02895 [Chlamydiota bacterium]